MVKLEIRSMFDHRKKGGLISSPQFGQKKNFFKEMTQLIRNLEAIINLLFKLNAKYRIRLIINYQILYEVVQK